MEVEEIKELLREMRRGSLNHLLSSEAREGLREMRREKGREILRRFKNEEEEDEDENE